jgi:hypothetical protein
MCLIMPNQVLGTELRIFPRVAKDCAETYRIHNPSRKRKGAWREHSCDP